MADTLISGTTILEDKRSEKGNKWSINGSGWIATNTDVDDVVIDGNGKFTNQGVGDVEVVAPVNLPNGAKITRVIVYSDTANPSYLLRRTLLPTGVAETMASASMNTADTTISGETVNNDSYGYYLMTENLSQNESIYGAVIEYD